MEEGIIIRRYAGFYYVDTGAKIWECRLRGRHRLTEQDFLAGDRVRITPVGPQQGVIEEVLPRRTRLERPAVANVDLVMVVMSFVSPPPDLKLLDRLLILAAAHGIEAGICWNKVDLIEAGEGRLPGFYSSLGYSSILTSARTGQGIPELGRLLAGHIAAFAGPSGVGKSSLLNALIPGLALKTGEVSRKIDRGRHTTRHVELLRLPGGGLIADTPGFSRLDLPKMERQELASYFPEMLPFLGRCRFNSCLHRSEPGCAVREAVAAGKVDGTRYKHYLEFLEEIILKEKEYY
ncbi:MAG: ribosome biosis GTPase / thiamine phosphate phosphatase [Clostridia bacterium]|nr:ribosome biosis GTPase / thiamine phosphate phosphatase [Clostridia bacterium]